ncbi:beta strand repeat-containing protein [Flavobacterium mekongense]|uniref:beta strand repeat-containing protein n=1 Tax=Flavobacterium mekongense TaxID=3379707 RepID=UPI00399BA966
MKIKNYFFFAALLVLGSITQSNGQVDNTFSGVDAGANNTGSYNTAFGKNALIYNTSNSNSAFGSDVLRTSQGGFNCAYGNEAMRFNTTGTLNGAFGTRSLFYNTTGSANIAIGHRTLEANTTGSNNTAVGYASLTFNVGNDNVAIGALTPRNLLTGNANVFIGTETAINLKNGSFNVFLGRVRLNNTFSTDRLAGFNTDKTIILADGAGNQRLFIHSNGNTGLGLGNNIIPANRLDVNGGVVIGKSFVPRSNTSDTNAIIAPLNGMLVEGSVGIGTTAPGNKVEIKHGRNGFSGLRFTNLTSSFNPSGSLVTNKFLTVNENGDVVLQNLPNSLGTNVMSSNANIMTTNVNNIQASAPIVNSISNTINTSNQLITTVNGVASAPVNLPPRIPQTLSQSGNVITLSNGGGSFTLPTFTDTDTDAQSLSLSGNVLSISNGNSVTLPAQTPQTLSQAGNVVTLSNGGGSFTLPSLTDTDAQSLTLSGNVLSISNGNSVTLPPHTPQTLSQSGNTITLSNGGGSFNLPTTSVVAGTNVTVTGTGTTASPFVVSANDTSLYANNGIINQATTISGNRVVDMNNSNIWFSSANSTSNGKIYVGSTAVYPNTTGNYRLFVEGGILTEKVKVALRSSANWADYVFANDYKLMPLNEVEAFVKTNKHLPGIDSAEDLAKEGIDVAEMQSKQMEKIEELTLYIIDQDKKIAEQAKALEKNSKELEALKLQIQALIDKTK